MRRLLLGLLFCVAPMGPAFAGSRPVVVELFTSQGCSSCPPADELLTSLAQRRDVLALAFHVTYWNALGWRDPYSSETATRRQAVYASRLGGGSYTPEIVVDGRRGMVGSARGKVLGAVAASRREAQATVPLRLERNGGRVAIALEASASAGRILLIGFDARHETPVGRGENGGRTLVESNIVRSLQVVGDYTGVAVSTSAERGAGDEAAVIVQAPDGRIIAAGRL